MCAVYRLASLTYLAQETSVFVESTLTANRQVAGFGPPEYLIIDWLVLMGCLSMMARWSTAIGVEIF